MKSIFAPGDERSVTFIVKQEDLAAFQGEQVHPVLSTFALAREAEWACRQFVLEMREPHEEGIGISLSIEHRSPAKPGEQVQVLAQVKSLEGNTLICTWQARVGERLIAKGEQGQKVLPREKIKQLFESI